MDSLRRKPGLGKGVLDAGVGTRRFAFDRFYPPADLAPFVEHFWTVYWDLSGQPPHVQETLPYPAVHVVLERGRSEIVGVVTGKFERLLEGRGRVFAAKFLPAGFHGFLGRSVADITDCRLPLDAVFDVEPREIEAAVFDTEDDAARVTALTDLLRRHAPPADPAGARVDELIAMVAADPSITSVGVLAERCGTGVRSLQRSFRRYVGVGPKWVIRRNRLQDAAEALAGAADLDLTALAHDLGYADQAHFIRDFRDLVGATPGAYAKRVR